LVEYGGDEKKDFQFLRKEDLFEQAFDDERKPISRFKGEDALMTALNFLDEGKKQPVIYFTQGNEELSIDAGGSENPATKATILRNLLDKSNYQVKGLRLVPVEGSPGTDLNMVASTKIPEDAAAVVILGPRSTFCAASPRRSARYMNPPDQNKPKASLLSFLSDEEGRTPGPVIQGLRLSSGNSAST